MLRFDPFRELDRWTAEVMGAARTPRLMPMDAYRHGDTYVLTFDLPGVDENSLDITADDGTLHIRAERKLDRPDDAEFLTSERVSGQFSRQIMLGDGLDLDRISANYTDGVLTVKIPVAEEAKPRKIVVTRGSTHEGHKMISGEVTETTEKEVERGPVAAGV